MKKAKMVKAKLNGEWDITLPAHRAERPDWYTEAGWEKDRLKELHFQITEQADKNIEPVVYYVGAEEGEMPALCQMWGAEVAMFEPNPRVWPNIKAIWDANKLAQPLLCYTGFASNETKEIINDRNYFGTTWPDCANGDVIGDHGFMNLSEFDPETTSQVKIDDLVNDGIKAPTLLTMDVEGSEWEVLRGAEETIKNHKPVIILSLHPEFMYEMYHEYAFDCRRWIVAHGYDEELIDYKHEVHLVYTPQESK